MEENDSSDLVSAPWLSLSALYHPMYFVKSLCPLNFQSKRHLLREAAVARTVTPPSALSSASACPGGAVPITIEGSVSPPLANEELLKDLYLKHVPTFPSPHGA